MRKGAEGAHEQKRKTGKPTERTNEMNGRLQAHREGQEPATVRHRLCV